MRVLLVSSGSGSRGGVEIILDYLGRGLTNRGHEVLMWIPDHPRMDELAGRCARFARIIRVKYRNTYDYAARSLSTCINWRVSRRIAKEFKRLEPDIIHVNKQNLEDGLDLLRAIRNCAIPSVCTIHLTQNARDLRARAGYLRDRIARQQLNRYQGTLVAVQERRRLVLDEFLGGTTLTRTIYNGVPRVDLAASRHLREAKRRELGLRDSDILVLGLGRMVQQKRPFLFLRMAKELHKRLPATKFVWVGDGLLAEEWRQAISRERLEHVICCAGWQTDVLPYLRASDVLLHLAGFEGLPLAVIEAMAAGLGCAITKDLTVEVPFFTTKNVLIADDVQSLAETLRNPAALACVAEAGRRLVEDALSVEKMAESYEQLYLEATSGPSDVQ
jgi:glycosyltransferase involved in cell wall biosynthesis